MNICFVIFISLFVSNKLELDNKEIKVNPRNQIARELVENVSRTGLKPSHMVMVDDVPDGLAVAGLRKPDDCLRSGMRG